MNENNPTKDHLNLPYQSDSIDIKVAINTLWKDRYLIIFLPILITLLIFLFSFFLPTYYKSSAILMATNENNSDPLSEISNIAAIAGINIDPNSNNTDEMIEIIKSRQFLSHLITFEDVLPSLMASKSYDENTKQLIFDENIYNSQKKEWVSKLGSKESLIPSYIETHEDFIEDFLQIDENVRTGFITISIEHISPIFSKDFLDLIISEANNVKRNQDLEKSSKALDYLKLQYSNTSLVEIRESISKLIESEMKTQMLAKINEDYVLKPIDPPYLPEEKSWPKRTIIVVATFLLSLISAISYIFIRNFFRDIND